jgi:hypothetical protein
MLGLEHKNCGGKILIQVDIENIFGLPNIKIKDEHKIFISFAKLAARNVKVKFNGLCCESCGTTLQSNEEIVLQCKTTGDKGPLNEFKIIYAINDAGIELNPQLLHISGIERYVKSVKKEGFKVREIEPKIYLDEEVKHG